MNEKIYVCMINSKYNMSDTKYVVTAKNKSDAKERCLEYVNPTNPTLRIKNISAYTVEDILDGCCVGEIPNC